MGVAAMTADELNEDLITRRPPARTRLSHRRDGRLYRSRRDLGEGQREGRQAVFRGVGFREALR